jgi:uncharacterized damage-inducible protein DinB
MLEQIISFYDYGAWVNKRLLESAANLTQEQFTRKVLPGFGSLHLTFVHILGTEFLWLARWQEISPRTVLSPTDLPTLAAIREGWKDLINQRRANLAGMDEAQLAATVHWTNMRGQSFALPRWQVILHCANHSTHHRSEAAAILTELGYEPESTDLLKYYLEQAGQQWKPSKLS